MELFIMLKIFAELALVGLSNEAMTIALVHMAGNLISGNTVQSA